mgnify:CR=1 FL=1
MHKKTLEELTQDAMRYRWLRSTQNQQLRCTETSGCIKSVMVSEGNDCTSAPDYRDLDYFVDLQMAKYPLIYWGREAAQDVFGNVVIRGAGE